MTTHEKAKALADALSVVYHNAEHNIVVFRFQDGYIEAADNMTFAQIRGFLEAFGFEFAGFGHFKINDDDSESTPFNAYFRMGLLTPLKGL